jgi:hypothetical protein
MYTVREILLVLIKPREIKYVENCSNYGIKKKCIQKFGRWTRREEKSLDADGGII